MNEFFGFMFQVTIIFVVLWYFGLNFFKHSHYISSWYEKRKLQKLADENRDKVVDMDEVFKREFGFLETPEYVRQRLSEIKQSMKSEDEDFIRVNALEFIFLIDELQTQVLKTDRGIYIVSRKNINELIMKQERDVLYYARKMREYALRFLPKEGEPIILEADEVLYWVRNGMLRRPSTDDGNRVFHLRSSMEEVYLTLREDFIEPHYSLSIVSHNDFLAIKNRRNEIENRKKKKTILEPENELVEGVSVLFSDNTKRMKIGNTVMVTAGDGRTWKEDLSGNIIESDDIGKSQGGYSKDGSIDKSAFIKKESEAAQKDMDEHILAKEPKGLIFKPKAASLGISEGDFENEEILFSDPQTAIAKIASNKRVLRSFIGMLVSSSAPNVFSENNRICISHTCFVQSLAKFVDPVSAKSFLSDFITKSGEVDEKKLYVLCAPLQTKGLLSEKGLVRFEYRGAIQEVPVCVLSQEVSREYLDKVHAVNLMKDVPPSRSAVPSSGDLSSEASEAKRSANSVQLSFVKKKAMKESGAHSSKERSAQPKKRGGDHSSTPTDTKVFEAKTKQSQGEKKKKQKMSYDVFVQKFCTSQWILGDDVFDNRGGDCSRGYFSFLVKSGNPEIAEVSFGFGLFREKLLSFLEKEGIEYRDSRSFFNGFLRDGDKGDISVRYFYTTPDNTAIKAKVATLNIPIDRLDGLRLDVGIRGGYRLSEIGRIIEESELIGDSGLTGELKLLQNQITKGEMIDCEERDNG